MAHLDALVDEAVESHLKVALRGREPSDMLDVLGPPRCTLVIRGSALSVGRAADRRHVHDRGRQRAGRLDAIRTDFVANISHELQTPVGAIALLAETLADEDEPEVIARLPPS